MPRLSYRPQTEGDPENVSVGSYHFDKGKSVEVDDATFDRLKSNPWFSGSRDAKAKAEAASAGERNPLDSSIDPQYPPGSGMKYPGTEPVKTEDGLVPNAQASQVDGANTLDDEDGKGRKGKAKP